MMGYGTPCQLPCRCTASASGVSVACHITTCLCSRWEGTLACGLAALLMLRTEAQPWRLFCRDMSAACQLMLLPNRRLVCCKVSTRRISSMLI